MPPYLGFGSCSFQDYSFTGCNILDLPRSIFVQGVCIRSKRTKNRLPAESRFCRQPVSSFMDYSFTGCNILDLPRSIFVQGVCIRSKRTKNRLPAESRFCRQPVSSFMEMDASFEHAKNLPQFLDFHLGLSESLDCRLSGCGFWSGHSCSRPSVCLSPGRLFGH